MIKVPYNTHSIQDQGTLQYTLIQDQSTLYFTIYKLSRYPAIDTLYKIKVPNNVFLYKIKVSSNIHNIKGPYPLHFIQDKYTLPYKQYICYLTLQFKFYTIST